MAEPTGLEPATSDVTVRLSGFRKSNKGFGNQRFT